MENIYRVISSNIFGKRNFVIVINTKFKLSWQPTNYNLNQTKINSWNKFKQGNIRNGQCSKCYFMKDVTFLISQENFRVFKIHKI